MKNDKREKILQKTNGRCGYCGCQLTGKYHIDHMNPKGFGGTDDFDNLVASCISCNLYKSQRTVEMFREDIENTHNAKIKNDSRYRNAVKFGVVQNTDKKVIFYFEEILK